MVDLFQPASSGLPDPAVGSPVEARGILVVDDNLANLVAIEAALGELAGRMVRAQSGTEALRRLLEQDFALILLDVQMPSMDGFQAARLIRERRRSRYTPIIFVTAHSRDDEAILEAYKLGAVDFLFKPIVPEILRAKAAVFVDLQQRTAEVARQAELLRAHERREHERALEEERRRWEEEALRRQMAGAQRSAEALARKAEELARTVAEKERAEAELVRINAALAESDRRKDEFLAMLGHELRNPLAPMVAAIALLRQRGLDEVAVRPLATIERQVHHLSRLVDDLLDNSRISSGKIDLQRTSVVLQEVIEQAVATSRPLIEEREHRLVVSLPAVPLVVSIDSIRMIQVIANLLNNAARYTDRGGNLALSCRVNGEEIELRVADDGRGISADLLPRIFDLFVQERTGGGGLGLGLTLVKRLVDLHGGSVVAESAGLGRGSEFIVRLPVVPSAGAETPGTLAGAAPPAGGPSPMQGGSQPGGTPPQSGEARPLVVALVEDNADIRETMQELLSMWGHTVETAEDGPRGVALILRLQPDIAFVDIGLPELDGYGVARQVRAALPPDRLRLVAMSGYGQDSDKRKAIEAGFDSHLVKPASLDTIEKLLTFKSG